MKVTPSPIAENAATRAASTRAASSDTKAFKSTLEKAEITLRKGEEMVAVEGHAYAEITKGARAGMFINTSGNVRHGQAFTVAQRDGKEYHIYGTGKDRLVVGFHVPKDTGTDTTTDTKTDAKPDAVDTSKLKLRKNEKVEPVEGHAYAEITSGAREGMYINTSGNKRHGEAFVLVHKAGVEYHIYGSGADREVIALEPRKKRDDD
jgi:restriction endonuclease Mrr